MNMPDYYNVVKEPLDLGKIRTKLEDGEYLKPEDFEADVRKIIANAVALHRESDEVNAAAQRISNFFDENWSKMQGDLYNTPGEGDRPDDADFTIGGMNRKGSAMGATPSRKEGVIAASSSSATKSKEGSKTSSTLNPVYMRAIQESGWKGGAYEVMQKLIQHENAWAFMGPLQFSDQNAANQAKRNVDIRTVMDKLSNGDYTRGGRKDFLRDIRSVFSNAMAHYEEEHQLHGMAKEMQEIFNTEWQNLMHILDRKDSLKFLPIPDDPNSKFGAGIQREFTAKENSWPEDCKKLIEDVKKQANAWNALEAYVSKMGAENVDLDQIISRLDAGEYETADVLVQEVDNVFDTVIDLINSSEDKNEGIENLELMNRARFLKSEFSQKFKALQSAWSSSGRGGSHYKKTLKSVFLGEGDETILELPRKFYKMEVQDLPWKNGLQQVLSNIQDHLAKSEEGKYKISRRRLDKLSDEIDSNQIKHPATFMIRFWKALNCFKNDDRVPTANKPIWMMFVKDFMKKISQLHESSVRDMSDIDEFTKVGKGPSEEDPEVWLVECLHTLNRVFKHPAAWPFVIFPVGENTKIKRLLALDNDPIDFYTIVVLLKHGYYTNSEQVVADIRSVLQIIPNFLSGSDSGSLEHELAHEVLETVQHSFIFRDHSISSSEFRDDKPTTSFQLQRVANWKEICVSMLEEVMHLPSAWLIFSNQKKSDKNSHGRMQEVIKNLKDGKYDNPAEVLLEVRKIFSKHLPKARGHSDHSMALDADKGSKRAETGKPSADQRANDGEDENFDQEGEDTKEAEQEAEPQQAEESARRDVFSLDALEQEDHDDYEEMLEYIAEDDETPRLIAKKLGVSAEALTALNKHNYPALHMNARLLQGTILQLPPRQKPNFPTAPSISHCEPDLSMHTLETKLSCTLLSEFEQRFRWFFCLEVKPPGSEDVEVEALLREKLEGPPPLRLKKSQRFYYSKIPRKLSFISRLLETLAKDKNGGVMSDGGDFLLDEDYARRVVNPMDLTLVRYSMELGLYSGSAQVDSDIRLALRNAVTNFKYGSREYDMVQNMQRLVDTSAMKAKTTVSQTYGETGEDVPLCIPQYLEAAKELVDKSTNRPHCRMLLSPVRPLEDGCSDYLDVIREPMDLGTIRHRLETGSFYETMGDVAADMRLTFKNALMYNEEGSTIFKWASDALQMFEADLKETLDACHSKNLQPDDASGKPDAQEKREETSSDSVTSSDRICMEPPQVVPPALQHLLEQRKHKTNWISSFDEFSALPNGWQVVLDERTQKLYYWNRGSNMTTWEQPKMPRVIESKAEDNEKKKYFCPIFGCWRPLEVPDQLSCLRYAGAGSKSQVQVQANVGQQPRGAFPGSLPSGTLSGGMLPTLASMAPRPVTSTPMLPYQQSPQGLQYM